MMHRYKSFHRFLEQFSKDIEDMSKHRPGQYLAVLALSSMDSEWEPTMITGEIRGVHEKIIREFYFRSHRN